MNSIKGVLIREILEHKLIVLVLALIILFSIALFVFGFAVSYMYSKVDITPTSDCEEVTFVVGEGEGAKQIAKNLERAGLVHDDFYFMYYVSVLGTSKNLQAGDYILATCMSIREIVDIIVQGRESNEVAITFPEGFTLKEIEERLKIANRKWQIADSIVGGYKAHYAFLQDAPSDASLEGYLFPDTYFFDKEGSVENVIQKMLENFDSKLTRDLRNEIESQGKTIFEIITVASLIEKEVRSPEDKKIVSGIIWKRLELGMPLQIDATVTYLTKKRSTEVTLQDLEIDSLYNTYKYKGLPPGPISNLGISSIVAAIYAQETEYLFYLSKPDGETVFSRTLEEHNRAKFKYLRQ